jgi:hypothetical protein
VFGEKKMIFFGHRFIESQNFYHVSSIESILNTPPSSTLYIEFSEINLDIITHAALNSMPMAIYTQNITEVVYASALGASYIIIDKNLAKSTQNVAENYLFDAKILVLIEDEEEIEELAVQGIDGVIFPTAIIKINS